MLLMCEEMDLEYFESDLPVARYNLEQIVKRELTSLAEEEIKTYVQDEYNRGYYTVVDYSDVENWLAYEAEAFLEKHE